jgi:hypothetical protein
MHRVPRLANQRAGLIMAVNQVRNFGNVDFLVNLDGTGEIVGVIDSGFDNGVVPSGAALHNAHTDFCVAGSTAQSRVILLANLNNPAYPLNDTVPHGTHVAGSICGDGRNALAAPPAPPAPTIAGGSVPRGVAPGARLVFHSANDPTVLTPPGIPKLRFSQFLIGLQAAYAAGARVHNNSWGAQAGNQAVNNYTNTSGMIDRFAFLNPDMLVLFAAGNDEADLNNDGRLDQNSLNFSAVAKNILTIGACENETAADGDSRNYLQAWAVPPQACNRFGTGAANPMRNAATARGAAPMSKSANDMAMFSCRGQVNNPVHPARRLRAAAQYPSVLPAAADPGARPVFRPLGAACQLFHQCRHQHGCASGGRRGGAGAAVLPPALRAIARSGAGAGAAAIHRPATGRAASVRPALCLGRARHRRGSEPHPGLHLHPHAEPHRRTAAARQ